MISVDKYGLNHVSKICSKYYQSDLSKFQSNNILIGDILLINVLSCVASDKKGSKY